jgi:hypothetical protein
MKTAPHKFNPGATDRKVAARRFKVVSASGAVLSGSDDRDAAERTAAVCGNGARVVERES